jgi:hypothetical protein
MQTQGRKSCAVPFHPLICSIDEESELNARTMMQDLFDHVLVSVVPGGLTPGLRRSWSIPLTPAGIL